MKWKYDFLSLAGARRLCPSLGQIHPADSQLQHHRDEAEEHWHHQDTDHCGPHWWKLPGQLLARGDALKINQLVKWLIDNGFIFSLSMENSLNLYWACHTKLNHNIYFCFFLLCVVDFEMYQSAGACPVDWHRGEDTLHLRGGPGQGRRYQRFTLWHRGVHAPGTGWERHSL